ncbi:phage antirepressor KilAC domain-containing protein, partial [Escherichia coli]|uniref:phage antirepressor KilAC domain-containing protein n=1 Tax=Escherichia coli TaxID=562 RepID=UPI00207BFA15
WLRENGILIASGGRKNVPFQQYINAGYFTVKEVVLDDEDGYQIRLTPQFLIASGGRKNVPFQQYINAGYFTVKEVVLDDEDGYQ